MEYLNGGRILHGGLGVGLGVVLEGFNLTTETVALLEKVRINAN